MTGTRSIARRVAAGFGWTIVVAGALLALLIAGPLVVGDHPHTDLTGSMEPAISPGDVVIDEQIAPWEAKVGDIVTFRDPQEESKLLTHRVVKIKDSGSRIKFVTQGDANNTQEHWQVPATGEIARVAYTVPWVGHIAVFARSKLGWGLMIGIPLLLILIEELVRIWRPRSRPDEEARPMGLPRRTAKALTIVMAVAVAAMVVIPVAIAAFTAKTQNPGDIITAAPDFTPPVITATVASKSLGGAAGYVRNGGGYFVYANVSADTGNPASGIATVKTNVAELTSGQTEVTLTAGTFTAGGVSYGYRSAELTATAAVEGTKPYSVTAADNAGNASTLNGSAIVDNVIPTAADVQTANGGTTVGKPEEKDSITYTFSEPIDPQSILAGWTGASTNVVVRMVDNGLLGLPTGNDELFVWNAANTTQLPFGAVNMGRGDYVSGLLGGSINFGASGTKTTMVMSGNTITITFGTEAAEALLVAPSTAAAGAAMAWTPVATPYDRAGNVMSTATATQTGAVHKNF